MSSHKLNIVAVTEVYDFSINGIFLNEFRKIGSWNDFTEYRDPEGRLIVVFDPPPQPMEMVLNQILGKAICPGELVMISASPEIIKEIESPEKENARG